MIFEPHIEGVLFDIDDTLVDTRGAFAHCMDALTAQFLPELPRDRYSEVLAMWRADTNGYYRAYTRGELTADQQRMARANELHAAFGGPILDHAGFAEWDVEFKRSFEEGWKPFPESRQVVDALRERGYKVGALSNAGAELQTRKLAACGLGDVDILVTLDTFGVGKPDPRVFVEAARLLGADIAKTVYVGDELDIDARGAIHAGLSGIWVDRPGARRGGAHEESTAAAAAEGIVVVSSLDQLIFE